MNQIFRFRCPILKIGDYSTMEFRSDGPIPVTAPEGQLIGFAVTEDKGRYVLVKAAIDAATPERLDLETGSTPYWLDARLDLRGFTLSRAGLDNNLCYITKLMLTIRPIDGQEPIDGTIGELE